MPNTYRATATRSGRWWSVELHDLPPKHFGFTQGRDLVEAEYMARDAIALMLEMPKAEVLVDLRVDGADELLTEVERARVERKDAALREQATLVRAARALVDRGMTQRDAARLLGLSFQRVHQLLKKPAPAAQRGRRGRAESAVPN